MDFTSGESKMVYVCVIDRLRACERERERMPEPERIRERERERREIERNK
jgi:hypothetical protein